MNMLFKKKKNVTKDRLRKGFDPQCGYYYFQYVDGQQMRIDYNDLDNKSRKILDLENQKLAVSKDLYEQELYNFEANQRKEFLEKHGYYCSSFEHLGPIEGSVSPALQEFLEPLLSDKTSLLGLHRVGSSFDENAMNDVFNKGLMILGHREGATSSSIKLGNTVSYFSSNRRVLKELMYAEGYKNSVGSILVRIPDEDLVRNDDVLINVDGRIRLNPKYIVGYIPVYPNHHIEDIVTNPNYGSMGQIGQQKNVYLNCTP